MFAHDHPVAVGHLLEDLLVPRFPSVGLHGLDAGHGLDELNDHQGCALSHLSIGLGRLSGKPPHQRGKNRKGHQAHQSKPKVQEQQQYCCSKQCENRGHQSVKSGLQHLLDRLDVIGRSTDHPARGVAIVERDVKRLEVPEQPASQFEQYLLPNPARGT